MGISMGARSHPGQEVGKAQEAAPARKERGRRIALVGADEEPDAMGDDEAHEADDPRHRHSGRRHQGGHDVGHSFDPLHIGAEVGGRLFSHRHEVQGSGQSKEHQGRREGVGRDHSHVAPVGSSEAPHHPEDCASNGPGLGEGEDEGDDGGEEGSDHHTCQEEDPDVHPPVGRRRHAEDQEDGQQGTGEGGGWENQRSRRPRTPVRSRGRHRQRLLRRFPG